MASQTFGSRLRHAWNAFLNRDPPGRSGEGYSYRPDRVRLNRSNDRTIMTAINTRIAMDAAARIKARINGFVVASVFIEPYKIGRAHV